MTTDASGNGYEVTVTKSDGSTVEVHLSGIVRRRTTNGQAARLRFALVGPRATQWPPCRCSRVSRRARLLELGQVGDHRLGGQQPPSPRPWPRPRAAGTARPAGGGSASGRYGVELEVHRVGHRQPAARSAR